jgi:hypothetical protein
MAIPRPVIAVAASAVAAGVLFYLRNKANQRSRDEQRERDSRRNNDKHVPAKEEPIVDTTTKNTVQDPHSGDTAAAKELSLFLSGDAWHDEVGWKTVWERESIEAPSAWLRLKGVEVLGRERHKLTDHPALLAGCRRRWIVVCRYAGMDVADAATLWHHTDANQSN